MNFLTPRNEWLNYKNNIILESCPVGPRSDEGELGHVVQRLQAFNVQIPMYSWCEDDINSELCPLFILSIRRSGGSYSMF